MKNKYSLFWFLFVLPFMVYSQETKKGIFNIKKIGLLYNYGNEKNILFDDKDYSYKTNTFKAQLFYEIGSWKKLDWELIVQPQIQFLNHQLNNASFVQPRHGSNYLALRNVYTKYKSMRLYGLEFGLAGKKKLSEKLSLQGTISLGFSYIDTTTERLKKGFTFIENFSLGFSHKTFKNSFLYLGTNFGHVSNLNFQKPNDGYNILGIEIGYSFLLN